MESPLRNVALNLADLEWILAPPPLPAWPSSTAAWARASKRPPRLFHDEVGMGYTVWRNELRLHLATLCSLGPSLTYADLRRLAVGRIG